MLSLATDGYYLGHSTWTDGYYPLLGGLPAAPPGGFFPQPPLVAVLRSVGFSARALSARMVVTGLETGQLVPEQLDATVPLPQVAQAPRGEVAIPTPEPAVERVEPEPGRTALVEAPDSITAAVQPESPVTEELSQENEDPVVLSLRPQPPKVKK